MKRRMLSFGVFCVVYATCLAATAATILIEPIARGDAIDRGRNGFDTLEVEDSGASLALNDDEETRAVFEFSLNALPPRSTIQHLLITPFGGGCGGFGGFDLDVQLYGFTGDGQVSLDDASRTENLLGANPFDLFSPEAFQFDVDAGFLQSLVDEQQYAGVIFALAGTGNLECQISDAILFVDYEAVPEPAGNTLAAMSGALLLGGMFVGRWRSWLNA